MKPFLRTFVVLTLAFTVLICWLGDFNQYVFIEGKEYVDWKPSSAMRWIYGVGIASPGAFILSFAFLALERKMVSRFGFEFLILSVLAAGFLCFFGDLNMYVVGHGPDRRDWVKGRPEGVQRLWATLFLSLLWAALSAAMLSTARAVTAKPEKAPELLDPVGN